MRWYPVGGDRPSEKSSNILAEHRYNLGEQVWIIGARQHEEAWVKFGYNVWFCGASGSARNDPVGGVEGLTLHLASVPWLLLVLSFYIIFIFNIFILNYIYFILHYIFYYINLFISVSYSRLSVSSLAIYIRTYLKAKEEELWKLKYLTMQKVNIYLNNNNNNIIIIMVSNFAHNTFVGCCATKDKNFA